MPKICSHPEVYPNDIDLVLSGHCPVLRYAPGYLESQYLKRQSVSTCNLKSAFSSQPFSSRYPPTKNMTQNNRLYVGITSQHLELPSAAHASLKPNQPTFPPPRSIAAENARRSKSCDTETTMVWLQNPGTLQNRSGHRVVIQISWSIRRWARHEHQREGSGHLF